MIDGTLHALQPVLHSLYHGIQDRQESLNSVWKDSKGPLQEWNLGSRDKDSWEFLTYLRKISLWGSLGHGTNPMYLKGMFNLPRFIGYLLTTLHIIIFYIFLPWYLKTKPLFCFPLGSFKALISQSSPKGRQTDIGTKEEITRVSLTKKPGKSGQTHASDSLSACQTQHSTERRRADLFGTLSKIFLPLVLAI